MSDTSSTTHCPHLSLRPRRRRRNRAARTRRRPSSRRARPRRHGSRRGLDGRRSRSPPGPHSGVGRRRRTVRRGSPDDDPYRDWECKNPLQLFDRLLDLQFVGPAPAYADRRRRRDRRAPARSRRLLDVRTRGDGRRRRRRDPVRHADAEHLPAARRRACRRWGSGCSRHEDSPGEHATAPSTSLIERSWAKGLPAINDLRARARPGSARQALGPGRACPPQTGDDVHRLRLPGDDARQRPLCRTGARRSRVGDRRRFNDRRPGTRRPTVRARGDVVDVPGPAGLDPAGRRRAGQPSRPRARHHRAGHRSDHHRPRSRTWRSSSRPRTRR